MRRIFSASSRLGALSAGIVDALCVLAAIFGSSAIYWALRHGQGLQTTFHHIVEYRALNVFVVFLYLLCFYISGQYDRRRQESFNFTVVRLFLSVMAAVLVLIGLQFFLSETRYGRINTVAQGSIILLLVGFHRWVSFILVKTGITTTRFAVLTSADQAADIAEMLSRSNITNVKLVGFVQADGGGNWPQDYSVIGHMGELVNVAKKHQVDEILIATQVDDGNVASVRKMLHLIYAGVKLSDPASFVEDHVGRIPLGRASPSWILTHVLTKKWFMHLRLKRVIDILIGALGLLLTSPIFVFACVLIKLTSKGPIFYLQERVGLREKVFSLLKLRTMVKDAEKNGPVWSPPDDPRVTLVGRFLRKTRIDEIPQFWNVLKGDMSIVGPRPERPGFVKELKERLPLYEERFLVPPGITGWAQINLPYAHSVEQAATKLEYDLYYVKNFSLLLDLAILARTLWTVITFSSF